MAELAETAPKIDLDLPENHDTPASLKFALKYMQILSKVNDELSIELFGPFVQFFLPEAVHRYYR